MAQRKIRRINSMAEVPDSPPRRYRTAQGYIVLRWKVGVASYVDCYEHRYVMGFPAGEVHHKNQIRHDNRPENLEALSPSEHHAEHRHLDYAEVAALYLRGMSTPQIAAALGSDSSVVLRALRRHGQPTRTISESLRKDTPDELIRKMMLAGAGNKPIARALGVSDWLVAQRRREFGIAPLSPGANSPSERARVARVIAEMVG